MTTDDLIARLIQDAGPVEPQSPPGRRLAGWLGVSLSASVGVLAAFGLRSDLTTVAHGLRWPVAVLALGAAAVIAAAASLRLSVPGERAWWWGLAPALALAWAAVLLWPGEPAPSGVVPVADLAPWRGRLEVVGFGCAVQQLLLGGIAAAALLAGLRRALVMDHWRVTGLVALSTAATGAMAAEWTCSELAAVHLLRWHAGGFAGLFILTVAGTTWWLRHAARDVRV